MVIIWAKLIVTCFSSGLSQFWGHSVIMLGPGCCHQLWVGSKNCVLWSCAKSVLFEICLFWVCSSNFWGFQKHSKFKHGFWRAFGGSFLSEDKKSKTLWKGRWVFGPQKSRFVTVDMFQWKFSGFPDTLIFKVFLCFGAEGQFAKSCASVKTRPDTCKFSVIINKHRLGCLFVVWGGGGVGPHLT